MLLFLVFLSNFVHHFKSVSYSLVLFTSGRGIGRMASIRRQGKNWQAIVRRKGHATTSKTFPKKVLAERWARQTEIEISEKLHVNALASETTVKALLTQYKEEITPRKRSADIEGYRKL